MSEERPRFRRPWEEPEEGDTTEPEAPGDAAEAADSGGDSAPDVDLTDWEAMASAPSQLDDFSQETYVTATTEEYRGLAEEIAKLRGAEFERQAVVATMPGVDTGLVGFEDVTGRPGVTEEEVEAYEQARASDLTLRVATAVALVGLLVGSLYLGGWWFTAFLTIVMLLSLGEFYATVRRVGYAPLAIVGLLGVIAMPVLTHISSIFAMAGVTVLATVLVVLVYSLVTRRYPLENASITVFGMVWVGLLTFIVPFGRSEHPVAYVIMIGLVTAMVDIGSYFVGRGFGSRPLAPTLSPNKTVEGSLGGLLLAAVVVFAALFLLERLANLMVPVYDALLFSLLVSSAAQLGDLFESLLKRWAGVKDTGVFLPGHGGVLDRIDSALVAFPVTYFFVTLINLR